MSDVMRIQPFATQLRRIAAELERRASIFDIHRSLFWTPRPDAPFSVPDLFGKSLATPVGPSAGPHTQLSQNIVSAWLCGGRFIELKTVQVKDDLVIPRPCIDMADEGYNVEWSQELSLEHSLHEYTVAWVLVHVLPRLLGWSEAAAGTIFDMSVGYDLEGIRHPRMTRFMDALANAGEAVDAARRAVACEFPRLQDVDIPASIVNSVTLSTMHGCPPDEIERIACYLLEERGLHTVVKLNPTLLGKAEVLDILRARLGFEDVEIPDAVFDHDLQYGAAVGLITRLKAVAARRGLTFGVKLSNTLAMRNRARRLPGDEMYMSGRALYPVTVALYARLLGEFDGDLHVSYSAGADAENVATVLSCGALPVTGCTDLLKPGGVARLTQWLDNLERAMRQREAADLAALAANRLENARAAARDAVEDTRYRRDAFPHGRPKVASALGTWDCIVAPCVEACPVRQDVPDYAWLIADGRHDDALRSILGRNPLPGVTGHVCTSVCETRCTRNDYEESVAIRALKRVAAERGQSSYRSCQRPRTGRKVAVIGSGPSGLAAATVLALHGVEATIFEARDVPGGMMRLVPPFRLPSAVIDRDIERITDLGVEIRLNAPITRPPEDLLRDGFDAVYLASGFQRNTPLPIPGAEGTGVVAALRILDCARRGERVDLGRRAVVVGGGDTAMDAARTARRVTGGPVTVLYRRTRREMPAAREEVEAALEEGILLEELASPVEVLREGARVVGVRCVRNLLGPAGSDGRRSPMAIPGSEFVVACDSVVVAIGQLPALAFLEGSSVARHPSGGVTVNEATRCAGPERVYAGGDVVVEPGTIISACADGRRAAEAICRALAVPLDAPARPRVKPSPADLLALKQARTSRIPRRKPSMLPAERRGDSALIEATLPEDAARAEALRCVQCASACDKCVEVCPNRANYTFEVEPLHWRLPVVAPGAAGWTVAEVEDFVVVQPRQIVHVDDFCNECGNCATFCVHDGRPHADKPRLFLDRLAFEAEDGDAYLIAGTRVFRRDGGHESRVTVAASALDYEDAMLQVRLEAEDGETCSEGPVPRVTTWRVAHLVAKAPFEKPRSLRAAAEMALLHAGVTRSLPFLLMR